MDDLKEDFLAHYGIKGMKWGIRRRNPSGGNVGDAPKGTLVRIGGGSNRMKGGKKAPRLTRRQSKQMRKLKKTPVSRLSNEELKVVVERMNLENQYKKHVTEINQRNVNKGATFLKSAATAGKSIDSLYAIYSGPTGKMVRRKYRLLKNTGQFR